MEDCSAIELFLILLLRFRGMAPSTYLITFSKKKKKIYCKEWKLGKNILSLFIMKLAYWLLLPIVIKIKAP